MSHIIGVANFLLVDSNGNQFGAHKKVPERRGGGKEESETVNKKFKIFFNLLAGAKKHFLI